MKKKGLDITMEIKKAEELFKQSGIRNLEDAFLYGFTIGFGKGLDCGVEVFKMWEKEPTCESLVINATPKTECH